MKELVSFRTSAEDKNKLQELADAADLTLSELLNIIIEEYNDGITIKEKLKAIKPGQEINEKIVDSALHYVLLRTHIIKIFSCRKLVEYQINKKLDIEESLKQLLSFIDEA